MNNQNTLSKLIHKIIIFIKENYIFYFNSPFWLWSVLVMVWNIW